MGYVTTKRIFAGFGVAAAGFLVLGTVTALWENPFFVRMTPAGGWEIVLLAGLSALIAIYVAIRRPFCSVKGAGVGGVLTFLGIACPICNKVLLLLFGGELLLTWFEPVRIYLAAAGVLLVGAITFREYMLIRREGYSENWSRQIAE
jgi:hypothetical protein